MPVSVVQEGQSGCVHLGAPKFAPKTGGPLGCKPVQVGSTSGILLQEKTPGFTLVQGGSQGCTLVQVRPPGFARVQVGPPGCTLKQEGPPGCTLVQAGPPGCTPVQEGILWRKIELRKEC